MTNIFKVLYIIFIIVYMGVIYINKKYLHIIDPFSLNIYLAKTEFNHNLALFKAQFWELRLQFMCF